MRRVDEGVEVRSGRIGLGISGIDREQLAAWPEGPTAFVWRDRVWRVLGVQGRWIESGAWWTGPAVRAARGEDADPASPAGGFGMFGSTGRHESGADSGAVEADLEVSGKDDLDDDDLLCEQEVWRVEAANGREGSRGIYELAHVWADGTWHLRGVID